VQIVDANVLLYAVNGRSEQHDASKVWLDGALSGRETVGFSWTVLLAFVRLATHPAVFPDPLSIRDAASVVRAWLAQPTAVVVQPTGRHIDILHELLSELGTAGNLVNDAHLAALALEHGADIVSFDADFSRFEGIRRLTPDG
jgi:hypothetical protein